MESANPKLFSKNQTDKAGIVLCDDDNSEEERNNALEVLSNWRAAHNYPMHIFKKRLKNVSEKIDKNALSAQRLKRVPSIIKKLKRVYKNKATMKLTQMQDIAGCRVIMSNVDLVKRLYKKNYINGDLKHKRIKINDYITYPKKDGYRSIHLVYRYFSDKGKTDFNGLLVEVQIRSKLQHLWATAVETVDFFTRQAIKSNEGQEEWANFFRLVSSAFAKFENCPVVDGTTFDEKELYQKIKEKEKLLQVKTRMNQWTKSLSYFENIKKANQESHYFLLELDTNLDKLTITAYTKREEKKAIRDYVNSEKKIYGMSAYDVVLVGADTLSDLKKAYPNYFLDTKEFLKYLDKIMNKYQ